MFANSACLTFGFLGKYRFLDPFFSCVLILWFHSKCKNCKHEFHVEKKKITVYKYSDVQSTIMYRCHFDIAVNSNNQTPQKKKNILREPFIALLILMGLLQPRSLSLLQPRNLSLLQVRSLSLLQPRSCSLLQLVKMSQGLQIMTCILHNFKELSVFSALVPGFRLDYYFNSFS